MPSLTSGFDNVAVGDSALSSNATGSKNTATGFDALKFSTGDYEHGDRLRGARS